MWVCTRPSVHVTVHVLTADNWSCSVWCNLNKSQLQQRNHQIRQPAEEFVFCCCCPDNICPRHLCKTRQDTRSPRLGPPSPDKWLQRERGSFLQSSRERGGRGRKQMSGGGGGREGGSLGPWEPSVCQWKRAVDPHPPTPICHSEAPNFTADQTQCRPTLCHLLLLFYIMTAENAAVWLDSLKGQILQCFDKVSCTLLLSC